MRKEERVAEEESRDTGPTDTAERTPRRGAPALSGGAILLISLAMEAVLGALGWFWIAQQGRDVSRAIAFSPEGTATGLVAAVAATAVVGLVHDLVAPRVSWLRGWREWVEGTLVPFLAPVGTWQMLGIAISAGIGEELFFRGALQPVIGLVPTAILFGLGHTGGPFRRETLPYFLYTLLWGLIFGWAYDAAQALWPLIVAHAGFDFAILLYLRSPWRPSPAS